MNAVCRLLSASLLSLGAAPSALAAGHSERVEISWIGGPTMLLRFGPIQILTDPVLGEGPEAFRVYDPNVGKPDVPQARLNPLPPVALGGIDLVLVSHSHEDHLDQAAIDRLGDKHMFLLPVSQVVGLGKRSAAQIQGIGWSQSRTISEQGYQVNITAIEARHSTRAELLPILGEVNGYWLEFSHGRYRRTIYWTGDSFAPASGIPASLQKPDLFIPHLGGVGANGPIGHVSMGADHAVAFALQLQPKATLPIHHSTFSLYREPIRLFLDAGRKAGLKIEPLTEGGRLQLK